MPEVLFYLVFQLMQNIGVYERAYDELFRLMVISSLIFPIIFQRKRMDIFAWVCILICAKHISALNVMRSFTELLTIS